MFKSSKPLQKKDVVRRKGDTSGRTRVVQEIYMGGTVVLLNEFLDGWMVWDTSKLERVENAASQKNGKHKDSF